MKTWRLWTHHPDPRVRPSYRVHLPIIYGFERDVRERQAISDALSQAKAWTPHERAPWAVYLLTFEWALLEGLEHAEELRSA